jgi:hypothetical protein
MGSVKHIVVKVEDEMIDDDTQAWKAYPQHRWVFNKLEVALKFGYECGPACVPINKKGYYIIRPIYNLFGQGIGAKKQFLDPELHTEDMILHKYVPPGYFWCEYLEGHHYSIDYKRENNRWVPFSAMIGTHETEKNLTRFEVWEKIEIPTFELPDFIHEIDSKYLNIESKGENPFEIHLRTGNDQIWDLPMGSKIYPIWDEEGLNVQNGMKFSPNHESDLRFYSANGYLSDVRRGFYVEESK